MPAKVHSPAMLCIICIADTWHQRTGYEANRSCECQNVRCNRCRVRSLTCQAGMLATQHTSGNSSTACASDMAVRQCSSCCQQSRVCRTCTAVICRSLFVIAECWPCETAIVAMLASMPLYTLQTEVLNRLQALIRQQSHALSQLCCRAAEGLGPTWSQTGDWATANSGSRSPR